MELDDTESILASASFFEICNAEQQRMLAFASERRRFVPGDVLYSFGESAEGAYIISAGIVALADNPSRPDLTYSVTGPGALIGEMGLLLKRVHRTTATVVTEVDSVYVPRASFDKLVHQYPDMAQRAAQRVEVELGSYLNSLEKFRTVNKRKQS